MAGRRCGASPNVASGHDKQAGHFEFDAGRIKKQPTAIHDPHQDRAVSAPLMTPTRHASMLAPTAAWHRFRAQSPRPSWWRSAPLHGCCARRREDQGLSSANRRVRKREHTAPVSVSFVRIDAPGVRTYRPPTRLGAMRLAPFAPDFVTTTSPGRARQTPADPGPRRIRRRPGHSSVRRRRRASARRR